MSTKKEKITILDIEFALKNESAEKIKELIFEYKNLKDQKGLKMKALFLLTVVVDALVDLRSNSGVSIDSSLYQKYLQMEGLLQLMDSNKLHPMNTLKIKHYLEQLPGIDMKKAYFFQNNMAKDHNKKIRDVISLS